MDAKPIAAWLMVGAFACLLAAPAAAQSVWSAVSADPAAMAAAKDPAPDNGLPDGRVARSATGSLSAAWYIWPTELYGYGILGDAIEAGG